MNKSNFVTRYPFCSLLIVSLVFIFLMPYIRSSFNSVSRLIFTRHFHMATQEITPEPYSMAFITAPNKDVAKTIATGLVTNKLAACVNIIPGIISVYEWEDKIQDDDEVLMMVKTRTSRIDDLTNFVKANHPYKVCEVITTSIEKGNRQYLDWIGKVVPEGL